MVLTSTNPELKNASYAVVCIVVRNVRADLDGGLGLFYRLPYQVGARAMVRNVITIDRQTTRAYANGHRRIPSTLFLVALRGINRIRRRLLVNCPVLVTVTPINVLIPINVRLLSPRSLGLNAGASA